MFFRAAADELFSAATAFIMLCLCSAVSSVSSPKTMVTLPVLYSYTPSPFAETANTLIESAIAKAIPIVALAPVMTNWTKDVSSDANFRSMVAKTIVVAIVSMANMSINAYRGLTELKPYSEDLMRTVAAGRMKVLFKLRIPNSVPYIFTALKVAVPSSIISAIVSEYFAEYIVGVGRKIRENIVLAQYSTAWAYITVACVLGILMYVVLMIIQKIFLGKRYRAS